MFNRCARLIHRLSLLVLVLGSCSKPQREATNIRIRDSSGVSLVHLPDLQGLPSPEWHTDILFSTEGSDSIQLGYFVDARFTLDSTLLVAAVSELLALDLGGRLLRKIGRQGNGPGEYRLIFRLGIAGDETILVGDYDSRRVSILNATGTLERVIPYLGHLSASYEIDPIALLADGRMLATFWQHRPNREQPGISLGSFDRDSAPLLVFDSAGHEVGTLGTWPGLERVQGSGASPDRLVPRFGRTTVYRGSGEWTVIGPTDSLDLSLFHDTSLVLHLTGTRPTLQPTRQDLESSRKVLLEDYADVAARYFETIDNGPTVPSLPAFGGRTSRQLGQHLGGNVRSPK